MFLFSTKPASGSTDDCEKLAVDYQTEYGGSLIFLNPLNDNGSYELCRYCGHWLNLVYLKDSVGIYYYYDAETNTEIGTTKQSVLDWYKFSTGKDSNIWNISNGEHPPFRLIRN